MSKRHDIEDRIVAEAWRNPQFKKELLEDPRAAIKKHLKIDVPVDLEISVIEETQKHITFVLPANPAETGSELTLEALDAVAGGTISPTYDYGCTKAWGPNCSLG